MPSQTLIINQPNKLSKTVIEVSSEKSDIAGNIFVPGSLYFINPNSYDVSKTSSIYIGGKKGVFSDRPVKGMLKV